MAEEVSKGLVYNPDHSSLLVCSSNCSNTDGLDHNPNCDQDAARIASCMKETKLVKDSTCMLITTRSSNCTKKGLKEAIIEQASKVTQGDEYGLFTFIYCGGVYEAPSFKLGESGVNGKNDFVTVDVETKPPEHFLMLKDFDYKDPESYLSGKDLGTTIASSPTKPKQLLVILDCPYAAEIGEEIEKHLSACELNLIVSQGKDTSPYYLNPLGGSTVTHFFCHFLSTGQHVASGMVKLRCLFNKVQACCKALNGLIMVRAGNSLIPEASCPEGRFVHIIESASAKIKEIESVVEGTDNGIEETDNGGKFGKFLSRYYKRCVCTTISTLYIAVIKFLYCRPFFQFLFKEPVRLCNEASDWVYYIIRGRGPLLELLEEGVLEGNVINAVVGAIMFSLATIESVVHGDSIGCSNLFIQAYIHTAAALDAVNQDINTQDVSLLKQAYEFYMRVVHTKGVKDKEMKEFMHKIECDERDIPNVFV